MKPSLWSLVGLVFLFASCQSPQGTASAPSTAPSSGIDAAAPRLTGGLTVVPGTGSLTVSWDQATDDVTNPQYLQYRVAASDTAASVQTLANFLALTPTADWTPDLTSCRISGLDSTKTWWVDVAVTDGAGNVALFPAVSGQPLAAAALPTQPTEAYYASLLGLSGADFRSKLHDLLNTGVHRFTYDEDWDQLKYTDEDPNNSANVIEIYTGWSVPKTKSGTDTDGWNREHVWAKSHGNFGTATGPGTDLHHLRPADVTVNSTRSNDDFGLGDSSVVDSTPYGSYSGVTGCKHGGGAWEPRDQDKGDVARMIFYMAVMYDGKGGYDTVDLEPNDILGNESAPKIGKLSVLKAWNLADPPDDWEKRRNDRIAERQGNRNPFVDHPEWVDSIW